MEKKIMGNGKVHYAQYGEWGGEKTSCGRYYNANVSITGTWSKVTCKFCLNISKDQTPISK